jgi:hypothetical protein
MPVQLEAVAFNHDTSAATGDALTIRRNATQDVTVPEWRRGLSVTPEDSPAAYAKAAVAGNTLTIKAQLSCTDPKLSTIEVRALDADVDPWPGQSGCLGFIIWLLRLLALALVGNVLGEVAARTITFPASGTTGLESFTLTGVRLARVGVGVRTTRWRWQYRPAGSGAWTDFATTSHRIYVLLDIPAAPWVQTPGSPQLPWTEVLDRACDWASLAVSRNEAAERITRAVYGLGPSVIEYDCPGGGSSRYSLGSFDCTAFVERLNGGIGNGRYVNCSDCATITSTFANVVGCDLWQSRMESGFALNEILAIGSAIWQTACGWGSFNYHEVAWLGGCTQNDPVWDACLQVDGDADPTTAPHTPMLPVNLVFGATGTGLYRDRLCTPAGRPNCNPAPATRTHRPVI